MHTMQNMQNIHTECKQSLVNGDWYSRYTRPLQTQRHSRTFSSQHQSLGCIAIFILEPSYLIGQNGQNRVSTVFASVAMQYQFPSECMMPWYPRLWLPPPAILSWFQILIWIPGKSPLDKLGYPPGACWYQRLPLSCTSFPVRIWKSGTCQSPNSSPSSMRAKITNSRTR